MKINMNIESLWEEWIVIEDHVESHPSKQNKSFPFFFRPDIECIVAVETNTRFPVLKLFCFFRCISPGRLRNSWKSWRCREKKQWKLDCPERTQRSRFWDIIRDVEKREAPIVFVQFLLNHSKQRTQNEFKSTTARRTPRPTPWPQQRPNLR